ncbi:MAG: hypothetical protein J7576_24105 [Siphonobacter aquaeclarae]|nr:hypothetical protein [Siphonobacter aquaeclarae]
MDSIRIGEILGLTPATIAAHKKRILQKAGVRNLGEFLIKYAAG